MAADLWLSISLGAGIGLAYGGFSYLTYRRALSAPKQRFQVIVWGGMLVRMFAALVLIALIVALAPVQPLAFVGAFFAVFVLSLALEVFLLHRTPLAGPPVE
jgi:ABC-type multidrug transport system permease subunit